MGSAVRAKGNRASGTMVIVASVAFAMSAFLISLFLAGAQDFDDVDDGPTAYSMSMFGLGILAGFATAVPMLALGVGLCESRTLNKGSRSLGTWLIVSSVALALSSYPAGIFLMIALNNGDLAYGPTRNSVWAGGLGSLACFALALLIFMLGVRLRGPQVWSMASTVSLSIAWLLWIGVGAMYVLER